MKISQAAKTLGIGNRRRDASPRSLRGTFTTRDVRDRARRRLPRPVFDYVEGGADNESSVSENETAYREVRFVPIALGGISEVDTTTTLFGETFSAPIGLSPTGYTRMISTDGERAVLAAAKRRNIPYSLSTMASTSLESLTSDPGNHRNLWFQLYLMRDRKISFDMVRRAQDCGVHVLEIAVDTTVSGNRIRDRRSGLTIPPQLSPSTVLKIAARPRYSWQMLTHPPLVFENILASDLDGNFSTGAIADITAQFESSIGWRDIEQIRAIWPGALVLKGPISATDAVRAVSFGVDGIHLSNHGGRQLDQLPAPFRLVQELREAVGHDRTLIVDSGVRSGADVAASVAAGADAAFIGRPYLWGLAAAGTQGVDHIISILTDELRRTMQLLGAGSISALSTHGLKLIGRSKG